MVLERNSEGVWLTAGNVGDTRALLISESEDSAGDEWQCMDLTSDHRATNQAEQRRVLRDFAGKAAFTGGYLKALDPSMGHHLAVTRALGHRLLSRYGVIANAYVYRLQIGPREKAILLASDGLWDHVEDDTVVKEVKKRYPKRPDEAVDCLLRLAMKSAPDPDDIDNTTLVLAYLLPVTQM